MPNVFISYSHVSPDQDLAWQLAGSLEANGVTVFVDTKIRIGEDWVEEIDRQLRYSQYFVVLLSAASVQSDMVRREIAMAYRLRKAKQLTILPVHIEPMGELPYDIGAYLDLIQYVMWNPGEGFDPICRGIVRAIVEPEKATAQLAVQAAPSPSMNTPRDFGTAQRPNLTDFDRAELDRVKEQLAAYIGPMARLIVERAAKKASSWRELYEILGAEVPAGEERKRFLACRPR
jgi:TIR domain